jgi:hypothetical protein
MSPYKFIDLLLFTNVVLFGSALGFAIAWVRAREHRLRDRAERMASHDAETSRTDRIEQAIDAIAVEVERLSEAQRQTARFFAEREKAPAEFSNPRLAGERITTPH